MLRNRLPTLPLRRCSSNLAIVWVERLPTAQIWLDDIVGTMAR